MKTQNLMKFGLALVVMTGITSHATGATDAPPARISVEAGGAFPTSSNDYSSSQKVGFMGGAQYLHPIIPSAAIGVQVDYYHFGAKDRIVTNPDGSQLDQRSTDNVATLEFVGRYTPIPDAMFVPYLHSGLGFNYFHQTAEGEPTGGAAWTNTATRETRSLQDVSTLGLAYSVGVGIETNLSSNLILGLESAWHLFSVSKSTYGTSFINVPSVSLRLGWKFGNTQATTTEPLP